VKCKQCNSDLMIAGSKLVSDIGSTDVYSELKLVCINPKCQNYGGMDLNKAKKYETVRNKVG
jgi:adenylate kinase